MKRNTRPKESMCWDCANARAHICPWIGKGEKIWAIAKEEKRKLLKYKQKKGKSEYTVHIVEECQHYKPDEKRKAGGW